MNPDKSSPGGDLPTPQSSGAPLASAHNTPAPHNQERAANVIRTQISALYGDSPVAAPVEHNTQDTNTYQRTHIDHPLNDEEQWKQYHSAWQNYYQKYYEGYYTQQLAQQKHTQTSPTERYFSETHTAAPQAPEELSQDEALLELRQSLLGKVQASAGKIRRSRHFIPIIAASLVVLLFVFLQYNRMIFANVQAYVSPGSIDPQNIVIDPSADIVVGPEPRLIIPKINVDVPVRYDVGADHKSQMKAMEGGVAHFAIPGANSHPGVVGNTVIAGHSSNDLFDAGDYKFIFAQLERLKKGDTIYANYKGKRYTYVVTRTETVKPSEVHKLIYPTTKPVMTLITCTPVGTALNRFLVTAEQVSPDPSGADKAPAGSGVADDSIEIPGNSPTFFERLFGAN